MGRFALQTTLNTLTSTERQTREWKREERGGREEHMTPQETSGVKTLWATSVVGFGCFSGGFVCVRVRTCVRAAHKIYLIWGREAL
jgi:hypothetical protein